MRVQSPDFDKLCSKPDISLVNSWSVKMKQNQAPMFSWMSSFALEVAPAHRQNETITFGNLFKLFAFFAPCELCIWLGSETLFASPLQCFVFRMFCGLFLRVCASVCISRGGLCM